MEHALKQIRDIDREVTLLNHSAAILGWDQETYMPEKAIEERAEQLAVLGGIIHDKITDPRTGEYLDELGATDANPRGNDALPELERDFLRAVYRRYKKNIRLQKRLVVEMSRETSIAQSLWAKARKNSDFSSFAPQLEKIIVLNREKAEMLGYDAHPYDALLDEYEPGMKTADVRNIFEALEPRLRSIVGKVLKAPDIDESFLLKFFPAERQEAFGKTVLQGMQYDFTRGRLDVSAHPFTTTLGGDDVRITTRYQEHFFKAGIFGIIHECGHALYELGFANDLKQSVLADGASLGIHESQSRFWENIVGRSLPFWRLYYPETPEHVS